MAFDTYAGLQEAIGAWLCRDDLGARIPDFIRLAEARFNRVLMVPERELVATFTAAAESHELPVDFWGMRAIHADLSSKFPLRQMSLAELRLEYGFGRTGRPVHYAIQGGDTLVLGPQPNGEVALVLNYYASIPALSDANPSNWLLKVNPDVYLYGALLQAEAYLINDERLAVWKMALEEALDEIRKAGQRKQIGAAPLMPRGPAAVAGVRA